MKTITREQLTLYIASKSNAWAPSTIKSEHARLRTALDLINQGPEQLYAVGSQMYAPYTLKTLFIRAGELYAHTQPTSSNLYKEFLNDNARLFKNAYEPEVLDVTYEQAKERLTQISLPNVKALGLFMLHTGLRADEVLRYDNQGTIIGKGGKMRRIIPQSGVGYPTNHGVTYSVLHKALATVGLKPHTLRKLYATKLVEGGIREADLMSIMGWASIQTSTLYIQPKRDAVLKQQLEAIFGQS